MNFPNKKTVSIHSWFAYSPRIHIIRGFFGTVGGANQSGIPTRFQHGLAWMNVLLRNDKDTSSICWCIYIYIIYTTIVGMVVITIITPIRTTIIIVIVVVVVVAVVVVVEKMIIVIIVIISEITPIILIK